jgi:hypothetical protein
MVKPQRKYWLLEGKCKDYYKCSKHMKWNNSNSNKIQKQTGGYAEHKVPHPEAGGCGIKV